MIDELANAFIRPPREEYSVRKLGAKRVVVGAGIMYERSDLFLTNRRGNRLFCSHWQPVRFDPSSLVGGKKPPHQMHDEETSREMIAPPVPCVVYLHGNCGNRRDSLDLFVLLSFYKISLFSFDFAGAGLSEGEYITLGFHEQEDLGVVVEYLQGTGRVSSIALWGRSMGAVTALLYVGNRPGTHGISGLILDSPFSTLHRLAKHLVIGALEQPVGIGKRFAAKAFVRIGLSIVSSNIERRAGCDIFTIDTEAAARSIHEVPALFIHGADDNFVLPKHSTRIFAAYAAEAKSLYVVPGDHNAFRPAIVQDHASMFIHRHLLSATSASVSFPPTFLSPPPSSETIYLSFYCKHVPNEEGEEIDPLLSSNVMLVCTTRALALFVPYTARCLRVLPLPTILAYRTVGDRLVILLKPNAEYVQLWTPEVGQIAQAFDRILGSILSHHFEMPSLSDQLQRYTAAREHQNSTINAVSLFSDLRKDKIPQAKPDWDNLIALDHDIPIQPVQTACSSSSSGCY